MNKSQLIEALAKAENITLKKAEMVVNAVFENMADALVQKERIEIRGFGSFKVKHYKPYVGRNPKTGDKVEVKASGPLEIAHALNFLKAVREGGQPSAPVEIGIQACNPVHLALESYWKKRRVEWSALS